MKVLYTVVITMIVMLITFMIITYAILAFAYATLDLSMIPIEMKIKVLVPLWAITTLPVLGMVFTRIHHNKGD